MTVLVIYTSATRFPGFTLPPFYIIQRRHYFIHTAFAGFTVPMKTSSIFAFAAWGGIEPPTRQLTFFTTKIALCKGIILIPIKNPFQAVVNRRCGTIKNLVSLTLSFRSYFILICFILHSYDLSAKLSVKPPSSQI